MGITGNLHRHALGRQRSNRHGQLRYADGTATAPADYTATSGTLTFNPGETTKTIIVQVSGDTLNELNESSLSISPTRSTRRSHATGTGTILDDEPAANGYLEP